MKYIVNITFNEEEIFDATVVDDYVKVDIPSNPFDKIEDILDMNIIRKKCLERLMLCRQFEDDTGKKLDNRGLEVLLKESSIIDNVNVYILGILFLIILGIGIFILVIDLVLIGKILILLRKGMGILIILGSILKGILLVLILMSIDRQ